MFDRPLVSIGFAAVICFGAYGASAAVVSGTNSTQGVVDGSSDTRLIGISAPGANVITDVNITIDFMKCDDPLTTPLPASCTGSSDSHPHELFFRLTHGSTTIALVITSPRTYDEQIPGAAGGRVVR